MSATALIFTSALARFLYRRSLTRPTLLSPRAMRSLGARASSKVKTTTATATAALLVQPRLAPASATVAHQPQHLVRPPALLQAPSQAAPRAQRLTLASFPSTLVAKRATMASLRTATPAVISPSPALAPPQAPPPPPPTTTTTLLSPPRPSLTTICQAAQAPQSRTSPLRRTSLLAMLSPTPSASLSLAWPVWLPLLFSSFEGIRMQSTTKVCLPCLQSLSSFTPRVY